MTTNELGQGPSTGYEILAPQAQSLPLVFSSPHSGSDYPPDFIERSRLDEVTLRRSEDSFIDEMFDAAPELGAPLIRALFPRAYVDPNREPFELDPQMFHQALPAYANARSQRVAAGLGTIARVVANGAEIYRGKLDLEDALERIRCCYWPYHRSLQTLLDQTRQRFGHCILIDCHSMPSIGGPMERDRRCKRVHFVLGDCHGTACSDQVTTTVERVLSGRGYRVVRNTPYSGGFVTRHYGQPSKAVHALQIEVNRALYMDEERIERQPQLAVLREEMKQVIAALGTLDLGGEAPAVAAE